MDLILKTICKQNFAPYVYYTENCNPFGRHFQKCIFGGRNKYYGKDIYFKFDDGQNGKNKIHIAKEESVTEIVYKLLYCL